MPSTSTEQLASSTDVTVAPSRCAGQRVLLAAVINGRAVAAYNFSIDAGSERSAQTSSI